MTSSRIKSIMAAGGLATLLAISGFALVACNEDGAAASDQGAQETKESVEETALDSTGGSVEIVEAYKGVDESGETLYYALNEDGTFACLISDGDQGESFYCAGPTEVAEGTVVITDETSGNAISFTATVQDDDAILLGLGEQGTVLVEPCEVSEVLALVHENDANDAVSE